MPMWHQFTGLPAAVRPQAQAAALRRTVAVAGSWEESVALPDR